MSKQAATKYEDYLEAIAELTSENTEVYEMDLAKHFGASMNYTSSVLQNLVANQLVEHSEHGPITLTPAGATRANTIRNRHATMKRFFKEILKLEADVANTVACDVEHLMDERVISRFVALADAISERKDCEGLRNFLTQTMPQLQPDEEFNLIPMNELPINGFGVVVRVDDALRGLKKFSDLGLVRGSIVQLVGNAPFGDLMRIKVMSTSLSMRSSDAAHIWVRPTTINE